MDKRKNESTDNIPMQSPLESVDANKTISDAIAFQRAESSFDSDLIDSYIGLWREVQMKAEALYRIYLNMKISKWCKENKNDDPPVEKILSLGEEIRGMDIFTEIKNLSMELGDRRTLFKTDFPNSDDAWKNIFYNEYSHLQELNAYLGGLLPEEINPLRMPDGRDLAREYGIIGDDDGDKRRKSKGKTSKR